MGLLKRLSRISPFMTKETGRRYIASNNFCGAPDQAEQCEERRLLSDNACLSEIERDPRAAAGLVKFSLDRYIHMGEGNA